MILPLYGPGSGLGTTRGLIVFEELERFDSIGLTSENGSVEEDCAGTLDGVDFVVFFLSGSGGLYGVEPGSVAFVANILCFSSSFEGIQ